MAEIVPRGGVVDVRLGVDALDAASRRDIASRLKNRASTAYAQIRDVESYANLDTCRRERLLRHFGDQEPVAPCAGCDVCLGEVEVAPPTSAAPKMPVAVAAGHTDADPELFERLRTWRGEKAREQKVPAYVVLHNSHLEEISARKPRTIQELGAVKGVGLRRAARYGEELLALVNGGEPPVTLPEPPANKEKQPIRASEPPVNGSTSNGYHPHLKTAADLLRSGKGAEAVPELARALELGGEEAREAVNDLLKG